MKRLLNTLYVTTEGAYLAKEGETVLVRVENETRLRLPIHTLHGIVCFGQVAASPALMALCGERGVSLAFMSRSGRFMARVQGPTSGNVLLRRTQYRRADDGAAEVASNFVAAKIANCRTVQLRTLRDRPESPGADALRKSARHLGHLLDEVRRPEIELERVRGLEGEAARAYFSTFDHLISTQKEHFFFERRSRRPPLDNLNALLSFIYSLLAQDATAALEGVGLDPAVGFLHRDRPGRPSLALDLMEELRPFLADRLALTLINRQQVKPGGFHRTESGAVYMDDNTRKTVLTAWQERKRESLKHPFLQEEADIGLLPHLQAMLLARHLRGDLDTYPPFINR